MTLSHITSSTGDGSENEGFQNERVLNCRIKMTSGKSSAATVVGYRDLNCDWVDRVNQQFTDREHKAMQQCIRRGSPFGSDDWVKKTTERFHLESTLKPKGRPRKLA